MGTMVVFPFLVILNTYIHCSIRMHTKSKLPLNSNFHVKKAYQIIYLTYIHEACTVAKPSQSFLVKIVIVMFV